MIDDQIDLSIRDTGVGIPAEMLGEIFRPFVTTKHASSARDSGTGLGLAICRTIVENHGGIIQAESEVGRGTTMTVRLPCNEPVGPGMMNGASDVGLDVKQNPNHADAPHPLA